MAKTLVSEDAVTRKEELEAAVSQRSRGESLQSQVIVHRDRNVLLRPEIAFSRLDRGVSEKEFDLLQIAAILPAEFGAGTAEIVGAVPSFDERLHLRGM